MTGFMDLSREIRDMIYTLALVVDDVIIPYNEFYPLSAEEMRFRKNMPTIGLLGVSKLVEAEAAQILYGRNTWRITCNIQGAARTRVWEDTIFVRRALLFRRVIIVFSQGDVDPYEYRCLTEVSYEECRTEYRTDEDEFKEEDEDYRESLHYSGIDNMIDSWRSRVGALVTMSNLVSVRLDVYWLYCHTGCCRWTLLEKLLIGTKRRVLEKSLAAFEMLVVAGLRNRRENDRAQELGYTTDFVDWEADLSD